MNGYIGIPEKVNENVRIQKIGMAEKVLGISHYGLRAFHRNPGGKPDYRVILHFYFQRIRSVVVYLCNSYVCF